MTRVLRNGLKASAMLLVMMLMLILVNPMKVHAATADENPVVTKQAYTVTFSAGNVATFDQSVYDEFIRVYGKENVEISKTTGNVRITLLDGDKTPDAPDTVLFKEGKAGKYVINTAWRPTEETVTENKTYVVSYSALTKGVEYTIKYVDSASGQQLAIPFIGMGNVGDTVSYTARTIDGYDVNAFTESVVLSENPAENVITFNYTAQPTAVAGGQFENPANAGNATGNRPARGNAGTGVNANGQAAGAETVNPQPAESAVQGAVFENPAMPAWLIVLIAVVLVSAAIAITMVVRKGRVIK